MSILKTENLSIGYNKKVIIQGIDLNVRKGEIMTLIGPNGAGKSTLLKTLARELEKKGGNVYIDDADYMKLSGKDLSKKIAVLFTEKIKSEMMTCRDIVATGRYPYTGYFGLLSEEDAKIVDDTMKLVHVDDIGDNDFLKISDGQRQRVMLARAVCQDTDIIILDEPTSFLDIRYKLEFMSVLKKLKEQKGITVIMSLHELGIAKIISDDIVCIKGDKIDRLGTPEEIFAGGYIRELFDMEDEELDEYMSALNI